MKLGLPHRLRIALYQPEIAGNTGAIMRLGACFGIGIDIIEPTTFDMSDRNLKRAGMDYLELAALQRHVDWSAFQDWRQSENRRFVLFTTKATQSYTDFEFRDDDILMFGRESSGAPDHVHESAHQRLIIPIREGARSLNLGMSAAIASSEALRQVGVRTGGAAIPAAPGSSSRLPRSRESV